MPTESDAVVVEATEKPTHSASPATTQVVLREMPTQRFLIDIITVVAMAGFMAEIAEQGLGMDDPYDLVNMFSLSYERNIPTWLSGTMHATSAMLLAVIASRTQQTGEPFVRHWWGLSAVFAYISLDEFVSLHATMNSWFDFDGVLYFDWVIPASVIVSIFVLSYLKFLAHLPAITRFRFVRAGAIFVGGTMGVELALAYWTDLHGSSNLVYALIDWVEETMEMTGAGLFLAANIAVLTNQTGQLRVVSGTADAPIDVSLDDGGASDASGPPPPPFRMGTRARVKPGSRHHARYPRWIRLWTRKPYSPCQGSGSCATAPPSSTVSTGRYGRTNDGSCWAQTEAARVRSARSSRSTSTRPRERCGCSAANSVASRCARSVAASGSRARRWRP